MKLVVGLGNPDKEYENTRHNIGFMLLDYIFNSSNFSLNSKMNSLEYITNINGEKVIVIKPLTYMNLSGDAVLKYVNFYKLNTHDILVIHDDLDMSLGRVKLLFNHGSGGHNGIKDIILKLNSKEFLRLKIGIGKSNNIDTRDYVLGKFNTDDKKTLDNVFHLLRDTVNDFIFLNKDKIMQKYNTKIQEE